MVRFDPTRLDARDRERWLRQLCETPLLSAPTSTRWRWVVALGCAAGLVFAYALTRDPIERWSNYSFRPRAHLELITAFAIGCGLLAVIAAELASARARARCPWPCGRFLHRFGYVESDPRSVFFVPGPEVGLEGVLVVVGPFSRTFENRPISVRLRCGPLRRTFDFWGSELDVPVEAIASLRDTKCPSPGYRGVGPLVVHERAHVRASVPLGPTLVLVGAAMASGAAVAATAVSPARAELVCRARLYDAACARMIEATYPWWTHIGTPYTQLRDEAITEEIERHIASPYRNAIQIAARDGATIAVDLRCNPSSDELTRWTREGWSGEAALPARPDVPREMWFLRELLRPRPHGPSASLTGRCSFEGFPVEAMSPHVLRAVVHVQASWELRVDGAPPVEGEAWFVLQLRSSRLDRPHRWYWGESPSWRLREAIEHAIVAE